MAQPSALQFFLLWLTPYLEMVYDWKTDLRLPLLAGSCCCCWAVVPSLSGRPALLRAIAL